MRLWRSRKGPQWTTTTKSRTRFKDRIRELTHHSRSLKEIIADVARFLRGWGGYFKVCKTPSIFENLDKWIRHRLRAVIVKQRQKTKRKWAAALSANAEFPVSYFDRQGLPRLTMVTSTS